MRSRSCSPPWASRSSPCEWAGAVLLRWATVPGSLAPGRPTACWRRRAGLRVRRGPRGTRGPLRSRPFPAWEPPAEVRLFRWQPKQAASSVTLPHCIPIPLPRKVNPKSPPVSWVPPASTQSTAFAYHRVLCPGASAALDGVRLGGSQVAAGAAPRPAPLGWMGSSKC